MANKELNKKAKKAAARYLELRGYEIVERNWAFGDDSIDVIAIDNNDYALCFIDITVSTFDGGAFKPTNAENMRAKFERAACAWLITRGDYCDIAARYDLIDVKVLNDSRAMIKHHVNASA